MTTPSPDMRVFAARLATFETTHHLSKRRASAQSKAKKAGTVEWPHKRPAPEDLARAGFFYRPAHDSEDNVQCFLCTVKLDGWEETDDPISEHIAHSRSCAWATAISVQRSDDDDEAQEPEMRDPLSEEMVAARQATFTTGNGWPHEEKKGWKCKVSKMLDAGWVLDPVGDNEEDGDGVTCFYCNLSLDGWEPKDDPFVEHKRRSPDCRFFQLLGLYHGEDAAEGKLKSKGRRTGSRASTTSKASRMSVQSVVSEAPSMPGSFGDESLAGVDDSILTTATNASQVTTAGATKPTKKGGKTKTGAKPTKGRKKDESVEATSQSTVQYPELNQAFAAAEAGPQESISASQAKVTRKGSRTSKQIDASVVEISHIDPPAKKATRGRKAKAQQQPAPGEAAPVPETPDAEAVRQQRLSEVSAQLQDELEQSVDDFEPLDESTPVVEVPKPKRGVKRTSDGQRKILEVDSSALEHDAPVQPKPKAKRGRPAKSSAVATDAEIESSVTILQPGVLESRIEAPIMTETKPKNTKGKPKGKPKGKKTSSTRTSRSSRATATASEAEPAADEPEDLARDELEIEQELARIAAEQASHQALQAEQDKIDEFEPSPSSGRISKDSAELSQMQDEKQPEPENAIPEKDFGSAPRQSTKSVMPGGFTPSPASSNKENEPSSAFEPSAKQAAPAVVASPVKTTRIPLAATTPNKSPTKTVLSPSKHISHLSSTLPWSAVDLDTVLLPSPQPTPGKLSQQLVAAAGGLASPEKMMSVEDWVRYRAEKGEEELRRKCEEMVAVFEKQGMRALETLNGINVSG